MSASYYFLLYMNDAPEYPSVILSPDAGIVEIQPVPPVVIILGSATVIPTITVLNSSVVSPVVVFGSIAIIPSIAEVDISSISPIVILGSLSVTAISIVNTSGLIGAVSYGSVSVTPSACIVNVESVSPNVIRTIHLLNRDDILGFELSKDGAPWADLNANPSMNSYSLDYSKDGGSWVGSRFVYEFSPEVVILNSSIIAPIVIVNLSVFSLPCVVNCRSQDPNVVLGNLAISTISELNTSCISPTVLSGSIIITPSVCIVNISGINPHVMMDLDIHPAACILTTHAGVRAPFNYSGAFINLVEAASSDLFIQEESFLEVSNLLW